MRAERGTDSWFGSVWRIKALEAEKGVIGILSFEVMSLMSKLVKLWKSSSDLEILKLRDEISTSTGIKKLISEDEDYLMSLAMDEIIRKLVYVAKSVVRLGKRCADPRYHKLEAFFLDPVTKSSEWSGWEYRWKKMDRKVKKMERFMGHMLQLIQEQEVLLELEQTLRRMKANFRTDKLKLFEYRQKVMWHREEVRNIRDMSPWNRSYDYIVRLLTRSIFTILDRLSFSFGMNEPKARSSPTHSRSYSALRRSSVHPSGYSCTIPDMGPLRGMGCIDGGFGSPPVLQRSKSNAGESTRRPNYASLIYSRLLFYYSKHPRAPLAPPNTLGEAALCVHYANVIVLIEKLASSSSPGLVGLDSREDLYNMLPFSIRAALRKRLKNKASIYDAAISEQRSGLLNHVLDWLAPLAHDTIKWQSEQNIEEQHMVSGSNVLLVQTLFFADRAKTEAAIIELLVGLTYVCRVHKKLRKKVQP